ncbi:MAG: biotin/lipoyl-containing protein [Acidobacteriota bacterium]
MEELIIDDTPYETLYTEKYRKRKPWQPHDPKRVTAFIPGTICDVQVRAGQTVKTGDTLFVFEAMKMINTVKAAESGTVKAVHVTAGAMVSKGQLLVEFQ